MRLNAINFLKTYILINIAQMGEYQWSDFENLDEIIQRKKKNELNKFSGVGWIQSADLSDLVGKLELKL